MDGVGAIRNVEVVTGKDDRRALAEARSLLRRRPEYFGFELWRRDRRVQVGAALAS